MIDSKAIERAVLEDRDRPCLFGVRGPCFHPRCLEADYETKMAAAKERERVLRWARREQR